MTRNLIELKQIKNSPTSYGEFWRGLGGHFSSLTKLLFEFTDNSLSDFTKNRKENSNIQIRFSRLDTAGVVIQIEDNGGGILNLDSAFEIGSIHGRESSLNEHGFGMKHALASANPSNDAWSITTRTKEDALCNRFSLIEAPYKIDGIVASIIMGNELDSETGTKIEFICSSQFFRTIMSRLYIGKKTMESFVDVLAEDIGHRYSKIIERGVASIFIQYIDENNTRKNRKVEAVLPRIESLISPGHNIETFNLGNGDVIIEYEFCMISENPQLQKHYKRNMSSSGAEIRLNGCLIEDNIFSEIWRIKKHNSYNSFLVRIDVQSDFPERLPSTTSSKTGFRRDDPKLAALFSFILSKLKTPKSDEKISVSERELFVQLCNNKRQYLSATDIIELEQTTFNGLDEKIKIDMYLCQNNKISIYEGKRDKSTPKDVFQLMMYWFGLVYDGIQPNRGILISANHPQSVLELVKLINTMTDDNGKFFNFVCKTWKEEGVTYPARQT